MFFLKIKIYVYGGLYACLEVEEYFLGVSSLYNVGPMDQTQDFRIGGKHLYSVSHRASPEYFKTS